jgi:hypothetical protein
MTAVHFASVTSFYKWDKYEWFMVGGFLNQIAGVAWVDEIEVIRIMLFKFGGTDGKWNWEKSRICAEYMRLVVKKVASVHGFLHRFHHNHYTWFPETLYRIKAIGVLANIDATGLQLMMQSPERERYLSERREGALHRYENYYDDEELTQEKYDEEAVDDPQKLAKQVNVPLLERKFHDEWKGQKETEMIVRHLQEQSATRSLDAEKLLRIAESREIVESWVDAIDRLKNKEDKWKRREWYYGKV